MLSAFKNFGVTFLISLAIFGVIAYFATGFVTGTVTDILQNEHDKLSEIIQNNDPVADDTEDISDNPDVTPEKEILGESFNFLIVTTDYRPDAFADYLPAQEDIKLGRLNQTKPTDYFGYLSSEYRVTNVTSIVAVRIDKEREQVIYSYVTPKIRVFTSAGYKTLSEVYGLYGIEKLAEHINGLTGLKYEYTFLLNGYNMDELVGIVGSLGVSVSRDIYTDGKYNTFASDRIVETTDKKGNTSTQYVANQKVLQEGYIAFSAETLYNAVSVIEHSATELNTKQTLSIEITRSFLTYLAGLDEDHLKTVLAQLLITEENWESIPELIEGIKRPEPEVPIDPSGSGLPFDTTPVETEVETLPPETEAPETEAPVEETEAPETEAPETEEPEEETKLFEPDTTVFESNFTVEEFYEIYDLLCSVLRYEHKIITYPVTYIAATEDSDEYFAHDINRATELFSQYRQAPDNK